MHAVWNVNTGGEGYPPHPTPTPRDRSLGAFLCAIQHLEQGRKTANLNPGDGFEKYSAYA